MPDVESTKFKNTEHNIQTAQDVEFTAASYVRWQACQNHVVVHTFSKGREL